ncbi:MAG: dinitrogenase iron-molybdenum cofactor biosynthesis protein [Spirochaetales bacterium]|nr:dinitrogenase iron-molybdenum cofactor biosynthesis protein [Spirochaetales bacterium]
MKIAFTSKGTNSESMMDPRFGRTEFILIYDEEKDEYTHFDNRAVEEIAHGAGPQTAQKLFELHPDILITGNGPGGNAATALKQASLIIFTGAGQMTVNEAYAAYKNGNLNKL